MFTVGLCGVSCSGKSTARDLISQYGDGVGVRLDGYYKGLDGAHRHADGTVDWEDVRSLDIEAAARAVASLKAGNITTVRCYDRKEHRPKGTEEVDPHAKHFLVEYLLIDSIFCLEDPLFPLFDTVIYLDIDEDTLLRRRRERQGRGPDGEWVYSDEYHEKCMRPSLERMVEKRKKRPFTTVYDVSSANMLHVAHSIDSMAKDLMRSPRR